VHGVEVGAVVVPVGQPVAVGVDAVAQLRGVRVDLLIFVIAVLGPLSAVAVAVAVRGAGGSAQDERGVQRDEAGEGGEETAHVNPKARRRARAVVDVADEPVPRFRGRAQPSGRLRRFSLARGSGRPGR